MTSDHKPLTDQERRDAMALEAKATPGPWGVYDGPQIAGLHHPAWIMYTDKERAKIEHANGTGVLCWANKEETGMKGEPSRDVIFRGGANDEAFIANARTLLPRYEATVAARDAVIAEQAERLRNLEQFRDEHFFVGEAIGSARQMITEQLGVTAGEVAIAQEGILAERLISPFFDDLIQAVVNRVKHIEARIADLEAELAKK